MLAFQTTTHSYLNSGLTFSVMKSNMIYFDFNVKRSSRYERKIHKYHLIEDIVNDSFMHMQILTLSFLIKIS